jgi:hypothetical protein
MIFNTEMGGGGNSNLGSDDSHCHVVKVPQAENKVWNRDYPLNQKPGLLGVRDC